MPSLLATTRGACGQRARAALRRSALPGRSRRVVQTLGPLESPCSFQPWLWLLLRPALRSSSALRAQAALRAALIGFLGLTASRRALTQELLDPDLQVSSSRLWLNNSASSSAASAAAALRGLCSTQRQQLTSSGSHSHLPATSAVFAPSSSWSRLT